MKNCDTRRCYFVVILTYRGSENDVSRMAESNPLSWMKGVLLLLFEPRWNLIISASVYHSP